MKTEQDQKGNQKKDFTDNVTHQNGSQITDVPAEINMLQL